MIFHGNYCKEAFIKGGGGGTVLTYFTMGPTLPTPPLVSLLAIFELEMSRYGVVFNWRGEGGGGGGGA